jgi:ABC-2 type transport system ATP-binding protein
MRQKVQFVAATLHEPELIIVDEPFSGLDPVNTRIIKNLLYGMRDNGAAIIMSTHQMHQVEEMCDRILLLNRGRRVLYGPLREVRQRFASDAVEVDLRGELDHVQGVEQLIARDGGYRGDSGYRSYRMVLQEDVRPEEVLQTLVNRAGVVVERFERVETSLDEIFVRVVGGEAGTEGER